MSDLIQKIRKFFALDDSDSYSFASNSVDMASAARLPASSGRNNLVALPPVGSRRSSGVQQIVVLEPSTFGEARDVADALKQRKPIIVNLRKTDKDLARRIVDFLSGIAWAIDGQIQKVADGVYIFTPATFEVVTHGNQPEYQKEQDSLFAGS